MKKIKKKLQNILLPFFIKQLITLLYWTNKKRFHHPIVPKEACLMASWHGEILMQSINYKTFRPDGEIYAIVSEHRDGESVAKTFHKFGFHTIGGSSTRGGARALIRAIKLLKSGKDVAITPDGPKGPMHNVADGIVAIAQKTGAPILTCHIRPSKYWQTSAWDGTKIPKPFGTIDYYIDEPFTIAGMDEQEAKELIKHRLTHIPDKRV